MNITKTKVGTRLSIGFALVLILLSAITAFGIVNIAEIQMRLEKVLMVNNVKSRLAIKMRTSALERTIGVRNIALVSTPEDIEMEIISVKEQEKVYRSAQDQLESMLDGGTDTNAEEKAAFAKTKEAQATAIPALNKAIELVQSQQTAEAAKILMTEVRQAQEQWTTSLDELVRVIENQSVMYGFASAKSYENARNLMLGLGALALLMGILAAIAITRSLLKQLGGEPGDAVEVAQRIAAGDLTVAINLKSGDKTSLLHAIKDMRDRLATLVAQVRSGTDTIATASAEIAAGNMDLSSRTEQQASSLEETASSMEELTSTVKQNAENARQANHLAMSASEVAMQGGVVVSQVVQTMGSINDSSKKIVDIISVIDGIAFQTNILALNAAVEAARAGEQGRGFAVVAAEVRTLAQRSAAAAKEIKGLIGDSVDKVDAGARLVDQAGTTMEKIVESIRRVTDIMGEITAASQEQTAGIEQINRAITQMDDVTQQNAALVEQAAAAAQSMQTQADSLLHVVGVFKLNQTSGPGRSIQASKPLRTSSPAQPAAGKPHYQPAGIAAPVASPPSASAPQRNLALPRNSNSEEWEEF